MTDPEIIPVTIMLDGYDPYFYDPNYDSLRAFMESLSYRNNSTEHQVSSEFLSDLSLLASEIKKDAIFSIATINFATIHTGLNQEQKNRLQESIGKLYESPLFKNKSPQERDKDVDIVLKHLFTAAKLILNNETSLTEDQKQFLNVVSNFTQSIYYYEISKPAETEGDITIEDYYNLRKDITPQERKNHTPPARENVKQKLKEVINRYYENKTELGPEAKEEKAAAAFQTIAEISNLDPDRLWTAFHQYTFNDDTNQIISDFNQVWFSRPDLNQLSILLHTKGLARLIKNGGSVDMLMQIRGYKVGQELEEEVSQWSETSRQALELIIPEFTGLQSEKFDSLSRQQLINQAYKQAFGPDAAHSHSIFSDSVNNIEPILRIITDTFPELKPTLENGTLFIIDPVFGSHRSQDLNIQAIKTGKDESSTIPITLLDPYHVDPTRQLGEIIHEAVHNYVDFLANAKYNPSILAPRIRELLSGIAELLVNNTDLSKEIINNSQAQPSITKPEILTRLRELDREIFKYSLAGAFQRTRQAALGLSWYKSSKIIEEHLLNQSNQSLNLDLLPQLNQQINDIILNVYKLVFGDKYDFYDKHGFRGASTELTGFYLCDGFSYFYRTSNLTEDKDDQTKSPISSNNILQEIKNSFPINPTISNKYLKLLFFELIEYTLKNGADEKQMLNFIKKRKKEKTTQLVNLLIQNPESELSSLFNSENIELFVLAINEISSTLKTQANVNFIPVHGGFDQETLDKFHEQFSKNPYVSYLLEGKTQVEQDKIISVILSQAVRLHKAIKSNKLTLEDGKAKDALISSISNLYNSIYFSELAKPESEGLSIYQKVVLERKDLTLEEFNSGTTDPVRPRIRKMLSDIIKEQYPGYSEKQIQEAINILNKYTNLDPDRIWISFHNTVIPQHLVPIIIEFNKKWLNQDHLAYLTIQMQIKALKKLIEAGVDIDLIFHSQHKNSGEELKTEFLEKSELCRQGFYFAIATFYNELKSPDKRELNVIDIKHILEEDTNGTQLMQQLLTMAANKFKSPGNPEFTHDQPHTPADFETYIDQLKSEFLSELFPELLKYGLTENLSLFFTQPNGSARSESSEAVFVKDQVISQEELAVIDLFGKDPLNAIAEIGHEITHGILTFLAQRFHTSIPPINVQEEMALVIQRLIQSNGLKNPPHLPSNQVHIPVIADDITRKLASGAFGTDYSLTSPQRGLIRMRQWPFGYSLYLSLKEIESSLKNETDPDILKLKRRIDIIVQDSYSLAYFGSLPNYNLQPTIPRSSATELFSWTLGDGIMYTGSNASDEIFKKFEALDQYCKKTYYTQGAIFENPYVRKVFLASLVFLCQRNYNQEAFSDFINQEPIHLIKSSEELLTQIFNA